MSNLLNVVLLIAAGIVLVLMYIKLKKEKEPTLKKVVVIDPEAQQLYATQKHKTDEEKTLTMQEKIELSWQFVVNIKNQVLEKFSKTDQEIDTCQITLVWFGNKQSSKPRGPIASLITF